MTDPTADPDYRPGMEDDPTADPVVIGPDDDDGLATRYQPGARAEYVKVDVACMDGGKTNCPAALPPAECLVLLASSRSQVRIQVASYRACMNILNLCSAAAGGEAYSRYSGAQRSKYMYEALTCGCLELI
jgi:hypothetical protein